MKVELHEGPLADEVLRKFHVVCISEQALSELKRINKCCRESGVKFVAGDCWGITAYVFVDFGPEMVVRDKDGEEAK